MTHFYLRHDAFICVPSLIDVFDMTHSYLCDMMHFYVRHDSCTGWRRPIECFKLQVIFCKRATDYRDLLQKMTCKDKALNGSSPPCSSRVSHVTLNRNGTLICHSYVCDTTCSFIDARTVFVCACACACVRVRVCVCVCVYVSNESCHTQSERHTDL